MKDKCVICGEETIYNITDHIDIRMGYVEGAGQLCMECFEPKNKSSINVSISTILNTPNDAELGKKIREIFMRS